MGNARTVVRGVFVLCALLAPFFFSFTVTLLLTLLGAIVSIWVPLLVGILLDTLYWSSGVYPYPLYSLLGMLGTLIAFGVHRFVKTSIMWT